MTRRLGWVPVGAAVAMVLVGCGTAPSDGSDPEPSPSVSAPSDSAPAPSTTGGPSASGSAPGSPNPSTSGPGSAASSPAPSGSPSATAPTPGGPQDVDLARQQPKTSWQQALAIARERFEGGLLTSVELGWERGGLTYSVELVSDSREYEAEISADDGEVLAESTDALDDEEAAAARKRVIDTPGIVAVSDAMDAAVKARPGRVVEWKLARNARGVYYEFDIVPSGLFEDTEVHVDAASGKVID